MKRIRLRFSLKTMLVAVTFAASLSFLFVLPTLRAQRFVRFINTGQRKFAETMLPISIEEPSPHRRTIQQAIGAALEPLTIEQLCHGERKVIVTAALAEFIDGLTTELAEESETAGLIVRRTTTSPGWHSFYQW